MAKPRTTGVETVLIPDDISRPHAVIAAMMAAGHSAVAAVADGATWEGEEDIGITGSATAHARRMAVIWQRAADHLQGVERDLSGEAAPAPADRARSERDRARGPSLQH